MDEPFMPIAKITEETPLRVDGGEIVTYAELKRRLATDPMTTPEAVVERVARAIGDGVPSWTGEHWDEDRRITLREYLEGTHLRDDIDVILRDAARAAIEAYLASDKEMKG